MRTVAYLRISTGGQGLGSQRLAILDYAHRHGLTMHAFVHRVRLRTKASRTVSTARTCRWRSDVRGAGWYAPSRQAWARASALRRSVLTRRRRWAYIGASLGSATMPS
jgi:hypothetical protein